MTTEKTTYEGVTIRYAVLDGNLEVYLSEDPDTDIPASLARFVDVVAESLRNDYPGAEVIVERQNAYGSGGRAKLTMSDDAWLRHDAETLEIEINENIGSLDDGAWIVWK